MTDPDRIAAAQRGDRVAFEAIVVEYERPVYNLCLRMLGSVEDAEDAVQETFVRAYRSFARYDPARALASWLLAIAAHYCIDRLRRRGPPSASLEALPDWRALPSPEPDPEAVAEAGDRARRIEDLLHVLAPDQRLVVVLRYWHDLGYAEIASLLDDTESAVKSRLHRARRQLAEVLAQEPEAQSQDGSRGRILAVQPTPARAGPEGGMPWSLMQTT